MHNPPHPGEILRDLYLIPLGVTITAAADALDVTRKHVSEETARRGIGDRPPSKAPQRWRGMWEQ